MNRIEEFVLAGKKIISFDLFAITSNAEFSAIISSARRLISTYLPESVYTVADIRSIMYDTHTKNMAAEWMRYNAPYVICGAVIGVDGTKRITFNAALKISGRTNIACFHTKEQAIKWLSGL